MSWKKNLKPQAGDILRVHRKTGYYHYGIAVSNDRVVHFTAGDEDLAKNKKDMKIIESSLDRFLLGGRLEIESPYHASYEPKIVVERAKSYVNSQRFNGKYYNFITNNCEHFANFIYYGDRVSKQVKVGTAVVATVVGGVLGAGAIIATTKKSKPKSKNKK